MTSPLVSDEIEQEITKSHQNLVATSAESDDSGISDMKLLKLHKLRTSIIKIICLSLTILPLVPQPKPLSFNKKSLLYKLHLFILLIFIVIQLGTGMAMIHWSIVIL